MAWRGKAGRGKAGQRKARFFIMKKQELKKCKGKCGMQLHEFDGIQEQPDKHIYIECWTCLKCGSSFMYKIKKGENE